jgi:hypothetical protein
MNKIKDGGPAFPTTQYVSGISPTGHSVGISMRDYFAAKAMQGMLAEDGGGALNNEELAEFAYLVADEMLKAREK